MTRPARVPLRRGGGAWVMQRALDRRGFGPVAGVDEAGRGACAGPLVVAACVLPDQGGARLAELTDSKLLTPGVRERLYTEITARAREYAVVCLTPEEIDHDGVHAANMAGMRRATAMLDVAPGYVLTDGFAVAGLAAPNVAVAGGDAAVACVAAASVLAKVTRDRLMTEVHTQFPQYGFDTHKGYCTARHERALDEHGPSAVHRWSYANVAGAALAHGRSAPRPVTLSAAAVRARWSPSEVMGDNDGRSTEAASPQRGGPGVPVSTATRAETAVTGVPPGPGPRAGGYCDT